MVDSVNGAGQVQNTVPRQQVNNDQRAEERRVERAESAENSAPVDTVEISPQAQQVQQAQESQNAQQALRTEPQAEDTAREVRTALQEDLDEVLGIDPSFAEQVGRDDGEDEA